MTTASAGKFAAVVIVAVAIAIAGVSAAFWLPDRFAKTTTTTITLQTYDTQGEFKANSTDIRILDVYAQFTTLPHDQYFFFPNGTTKFYLPGWDWIFVVYITWMNISPNTIYAYEACPGGDTNGTVLASSAAVARDVAVSYRGCTFAGRETALPPMGVYKSKFIGGRGPYATGVLVARGRGVINMGISLTWSSDPKLQLGWEHTMYLNASVPVYS